jgi:ABC-type nitrate/sulfonate/bicarbonate transport system ATPase subunit
LHEPHGQAKLGLVALFRNHYFFFLPCRLQCGFFWPKIGGKTSIFRGAHKGEFICVIGHSGCGKSTLLNMVSGFATPSSGPVLLDGKRIERPGPDRMVVFQGYALLPWLTGYENVRLGVDSVKPELPAQQRHEISMEHLELVGLTAAANKRITQLSGGMKQRVARPRRASASRCPFSGGKPGENLG